MNIPEKIKGKKSTRNLCQRIIFAMW